MNSYVSTWFNWVVAELLISFLAYALYECLRKLKLGAADRYRFLRLSAVFLPVIPIFPWPSFHLKKYSSIAVSYVAPNLASPLVRENLQGSWILIYTLYLLLFLYFALFVFFVIRLFISLLKVNLIAGEGDRVSSYQNISVTVHDLSVPPAAIGIFHPIILVPRKIYETVNPIELEMILQHEAIHIRRRDYFYNLLMGGIQALLVFSPFAHMLARRFRAEMELSCDAEVLENKSFNARDYGILLLNLISRITARRDLRYSGLFVSNSLIKRRIESMSTLNNIRRPAITFALFLTFLAASGSFVKAAGLQSDLGSSIGADITGGKELRLSVGIDIDTENGIGAAFTKANMSLNYEETGTVLLAGKKIEVMPTKSSGISQMVFKAFDEDGVLFYQSVVPFTGEVAVKERLDPSKTGIYKIDIKVIQF